jgi:hypothetical protein
MTKEREDRVTGDQKVVEMGGMQTDEQNDQTISQDEGGRMRSKIERTPMIVIFLSSISFF